MTRSASKRNPAPARIRPSLVLWLALVLAMLASAPALAGPTGWSRSDRAYQPLEKPRMNPAVGAVGIAAVSYEAASEAEAIHLARWTIDATSSPEQPAQEEATSTVQSAAGEGKPLHGILASTEPWPGRALLPQGAAATSETDAGLLGEGATLVPLPPPLWAALGTLAFLTVVRMGRRGGQRVPV